MIFEHYKMGMCSTIWLISLEKLTRSALKFYHLFRQGSSL